MSYYVYLIISKGSNRYTSYVGYTKNLKKRLSLHNKSKGAKFTRGRIWKLIFSRKYSSKNVAMSEEYRLKKNYKFRYKIKKQYLENK